MGQAKKRGTFEERRQQSIDRAEARNQERQRKALELWESLTPEQKQEYLEKRRKRESGMAAIGMWMLPLMTLPFAGGITPRIRARR